MKSCIRESSALFLAFLAALAGTARAGSGDLGPPPGVDPGDASRALRMVAGLLPDDLEADVFPLGAPDGAVTAEDARTIASAAAGAVSIPGGGGTGRLLFYQASLHAVDPAKPGAPFTVDAGETDDAFNASGAPQAAWSNGPGGRGFVPGTTPYVVYLGAPGPTTRAFRRVATANPGEGGAPPTPVQIASGHEGSICEFETGSDLLNPLRTRIVYEPAGADDECDFFGVEPDRWEMVRLDMSAATPPVALPEGTRPISNALYEPANGAVHGWLAAAEDAGATLLQYDPDFGTATVLKSGLLSEQDGGVAETLESSVEGYAYLDLDGALFVYDVGAKQLPSNVGTLRGGAGGFYAFRNDGLPFATSVDRAGNLYFLDADPVRLYRATPDGTVTPLATPAGVLDEDQIGGRHVIVPTDERVVFTYRDGDDTVLAAVRKDGTGFVQLDSGVLQVEATARGPNYVFYEKTAAAPGSLPTAIVRPDGGGAALLTRTAATWVGFRLDSAQLLAQGPLLASRALLADGVKNVVVQSANRLSAAGATLRAYNAANLAAAPTNLGTIPEGADRFNALTTFASKRLAAAVPLDAEVPAADVFFLDTEKASSLVRVHAATADAEELPEFSFF